MSLVWLAYSGLAASLALFTVAWAVSLSLEDVSIVDLLWGPAFAALAWLYLVLTPAPGARAWVVAGLVTVWAGRLAVHLTRRHRGEDPRYAAMRRRAGPSFRWRSLVTVFWLQAGIAWVVAWPLLVAVRGGGRFRILDLAGVALVVVGLGLEAVADAQLSRFRRDPASVGKVMDRGLWRYSRHPNYFGDAVLWWGFWLMAVSAGGWWTLFSPVLMTWLLVRISGVPLLEEHMARTRPGYEAYVRRTSAFVPRPPRPPRGDA